MYLKDKRFLRSQDLVTHKDHALLQMKRKVDCVIAISGKPISISVDVYFSEEGLKDNFAKVPFVGTVISISKCKQHDKQNWFL